MGDLILYRISISLELPLHNPNLIFPTRNPLLLPIPQPPYLKLPKLQFLNPLHLLLQFQFCLRVLNSELIGCGGQLEGLLVEG